MCLINLHGCIHVWRPRWGFWVKNQKHNSWLFGLFSFGFMRVPAVQVWTQSQASEVSITEWQPYYCDMDLGGDVGQPPPPDHFLLDLAWGGGLCWPNLIGSVCKAWDKFTPAASGGERLTGRAGLNICHVCGWLVWCGLGTWEGWPKNFFLFVKWKGRYLVVKVSME